jgi:hypothetical protein
MMLDDRLDDLLRDAGQDYNDPPETPRDAMWAAIQAARTKETETSVTPLRPIRHLHPLRWAVGIAALLALGIGLGRLSVELAPPVAGPAAVATQPTTRASNTAYQLATTEHLGQSETFLTLFRASLRANTGNGQLASATARQLLATNRLLLDSPAAKDGKTRLLLQDLELVLAEIAQLSAQPRSHDLDLITEGLERGGVMSRLRTAVPSGPSTQGAL